jgi:hypothetical protein
MRGERARKVSFKFGKHLPGASAQWKITHLYFLPRLNYLKKRFFLLSLNKI